MEAKINYCSWCKKPMGWNVEIAGDNVCWTCYQKTIPNKQTDNKEDNAVCVVDKESIPPKVVEGVGSNPTHSEQCDNSLLQKSEENYNKDFVNSKKYNNGKKDE